MSTPKRIQRRRTKGWRMPENAIYVGRPTIYGNPFSIEPVPHWPRWGGPRPWQVTDPINERTWLPGGPIDPVLGRANAEKASRVRAAAEAVDLYGEALRVFEPDEDFWTGIKGHDLACWCPLNQPCHADVLLELANREAS